MTEPRHTADTITDDALDELHAELEAAKRFARSCAKDTEKALKREQRAKLRADLLQGDVDTLRGGLREIGADPTQIQNLWAQISLRNRQWREEKQRAEHADAVTAETKRLMERRTNILRERAESAEQERDEHRRNYLSACKMIAAMHAAAVGEVRGPDRGVVEDDQSDGACDSGWCMT